MTIKEWMTKNIRQLTAAGINSARIDCLILLEYITKRDRAWLLANQDISLDESKRKTLEELIKKRIQRYPITYLVGHKEFYGLDLITTPDVLIPRPETENLIDLFEAIILEHKNHVSKDGTWKQMSVVDVGTGSGAIALAIKSKYPDLTVSATDISVSALKIARQNAHNHGLKVEFIKTSLLNGLKKFDVIMANLPYVSRHWQTSPETKFEPQSALYADQQGLELIFKLLAAAPKHLNEGGFVVVEHDPRQSDDISLKARSFGLKRVDSRPFATTFKAG